MTGAVSAGATWLAAYGANPRDVAATWGRGELARIPSGYDWQVVEAPLTRSVDAMGRLSRAAKLGPVLGYAEADRAWWLLPLHAEEHLGDMAATLTVHPPGWVLHCPSPDHYAHGRGWLEKPDGAGTLTDAVAMGAAFRYGGRLPAEAFG